VEEEEDCDHEEAEDVGLETRDSGGAAG